MTDLEAIQSLRALGQSSRWRILEMLLRSESAPLPVNSIAEEMDLLQNSASTQLAILQRVGLVRSRRVGRQILYSGCGERLDELRDALARLRGGREDDPAP